MKAINGVKIFKVGEFDWVFAKDAEEAKAVMANMTDVSYLEDEVEELSDEKFEMGKMYWNDDGDIDYAIRQGNRISFKEALDKCMVNGEKCGHFMTTEW